MRWPHVEQLSYDQAYYVVICHTQNKTTDLYWVVNGALSRPILLDLKNIMQALYYNTKSSYFNTKSKF